MLKKIINSARIDLKIIPIDPMLVKSGQATVAGTDMSFVRTYRHDEKKEPEPFIPGSSLKGMIRAYAEKICRSLRDNPVPVCLPYLDPKDQAKEGENRQSSCGLNFEKYKKDITSCEIYKLSCPACRLFGTHGFAGRFATSDAYLTPEFKGKWKLEPRDGVAIDRITGGAAPKALYNLEVLTSGDFCTSIDIRNFERWQLGLIGLVLRDMEDGLIRVGFGKSRGLGKIKAEITNFTLTYFHRKSEKLSGIGDICKNEAESYGFFTEISNETSKLPTPRTQGLRHEYDLTSSWKDTLNPAVADLVRYIEIVKWPELLENKMKERK